MDSHWFKLFLPFAAGYFLSYLYRTVNAVVGPLLGEELALNAADLGLLTSTYFVAFGSTQLPLGILLDRFVARRVESGLLLVAAAGAAVFAAAESIGTLALGRAMIGLGVSAIGRIGATYSQNAKTLEAYYDALERGHFPVVRGLTLSSDDLVRRRVIMAIMCQGELRFESVERAYPTIRFREYFARELEMLQEKEREGMVQLTDQGITVTGQG